MAGIQETKEAVAAIATLFKAGQEMAADGIQWTDAVALFDKYEKDPVFAAKMDAALKGIELITVELADISLWEGLELVRAVRAEFSK
jgi:hypothetical protein